MKKILLVLAVMSVSSFGFSKEGKEKKSFDERKAHVTANIDKRIASLNEFKTCVNSAQEGGIKKCHLENRTRMQQLKMDNKAARGK